MMDELETKKLDTPAGMGGNAGHPSISWASAVGEKGERMWIPAAVLFGAGDIFTTLIGFSAGAVESNSVPAQILGGATAGVTPGTVLTMVAVKALLFGAFVALWTLFPVKSFGLSERWRAVVPTVLTVLGAAVVTYNLYIIHVLAF